MKLGPNQKKWIAALRSGKFKRADGVLHNRENGKMCCLGVACSIFGMKATPSEDYDCEKIFRYGGESSFAPVSITKKLALFDNRGELKGLSLRRADTLAAENDSGATFKQIATFCEKHPEAVFAKSA